MVPEQALVDRFRHDLEDIAAPGVRLGIAVSGGPDSLALLLLAAAARPGAIEAATVDHNFRSESRDEARMVAGVCEKLGVPHTILTARWHEIPTTAIQERARVERYKLLAYWAEERDIAALVTGHHADDQAETVLMRLSRGAGVRGLAGMRAKSVAPHTEIRLLRPLLGWRHAELGRICADAGVLPALDPSNADDRFERVRMRGALDGADWLDRAAVARSAAHLAEADAALDWAMKEEWGRIVHERHRSYSFRADRLPPEILRRMVSRAIRRLATEGDDDLRGAELDRLLANLADGGTATLRGVLCKGGREWQFERAPDRR